MNEEMKKCVEKKTSNEQSKFRSVIIDDRIGFFIYGSDKFVYKSLPAWATWNSQAVGSRYLFGIKAIPRRYYSFFY